MPRPRPGSPRTRKRQPAGSARAGRHEHTNTVCICGTAHAARVCVCVCLCVCVCVCLSETHTHLPFKADAALRLCQVAPRLAVACRETQRHRHRHRHTHTHAHTHTHTAMLNPCITHYTRSSERGAHLQAAGESAGEPRPAAPPPGSPLKWKRKGTARDTADATKTYFMYVSTCTPYVRHAHTDVHVSRTSRGHTGDVESSGSERGVTRLLRGWRLGSGHEARARDTAHPTEDISPHVCVRVCVCACLARARVYVYASP